MIYVANQAATNVVQDGLSWSSAWTTVKGGLTAAGTNDAVWVAAGVYVEQIILKDGVALYGGFRGTETSLAQRDWVKNETILDGGNVLANAGVVSAPKGLTNTTRIDGFTIRNGSARSSGGGILCYYGSPVIANNKIMQNTAAQSGAGISCSYSYAVITNNDILCNAGNAKDFDPMGGGVECNYGAPVVMNNRILGNRGSSGGGISCASTDAEIGYNLIAGNYATFRGGGVACVNCSPRIHHNRIVDNQVVNVNSGTGGGGIDCYASSAPVIFNNFIAYNTAGGNASACGGGILGFFGATAKIYNNTLVRNTAALGGGIYADKASAMEVVNNLVAYGSSGIELGAAVKSQNNCAFGNATNDFAGLAGTPGTNGNISVDPRLVANALMTDWHLLPDSPCRHAGDPSVITAGMVDMDGQPRLQDGQVDIGADQSDGLFTEAPTTVVRISPTGDDTHDGSSWALAKRTVQAGLDAAGQQGGEVWVQSGTYDECVTFGPFTHLLGGFRGIENQANERDWRSNPTILDGHQAGSVVRCLGSGPLCRLDGLIVRNGLASQGGGVYCNQSSARIANNVISNNVALELGAGIFCTNSLPEIANNQLIANTVSPPTNAVAGSTKAGGAVALGNSTAAIVNNCMIQNSVTLSPDTNKSLSLYGSAVFWNGQNAAFKVVLANNTLVGNFDVQPPRTLSGGAIYGVATTNYIVANNVVAWNSSGMRLISAPKPPTQFCNNCVYGNLTNYMPATANFNGLYGNVSVDPLLVGTNGYHLQTNSPCIDAGNDAYTGAALLDLDGEPRILGAHADIGADEVVPPGAWQPLPVTTNTVQASIFTMGGITYARYAVILANAGQRLNGKGAVSQAARTFTLRVPLEQLVVTNACPSLVTTRNGLLVLGALTPGDYVLNISSTENENLPVPFAVSADTGRTLELSRNTATGGVRLEVNGITGWSYIIQVSPDLLEWTDLTATGAGSLELPANSFGSDAKRFFRAKIQP